MTQTQDEQNVGTPVTPAESAEVSTPATEPVAAEPVAAEPVVAQPIVPDRAQPQQPSENSSVGSILQNGTNTVTNIASSWVETLKWAGQAWVDSIQWVASQGVESVKDTVAFAGDTLKQTSETAISWIKWVGDDLKDGLSQTFQNITSWGSVMESGTAVVKWTVGTATNVVGNAASSVVNTGQSVVNGTLDSATNIAAWATNVVKDGFNNVVGSVLPGQAGQTVTNVTDKVTQSAQDLWNKAKETLQETGEKAKGFFTGIWDNFKSGFSNKENQEIMDQANSPLNMPSESDVDLSQPAAPAPQQPAPEVQPGDVQQPTPSAAA